MDEQIEKTIKQNTSEPSAERMILNVPLVFKRDEQNNQWIARWPDGRVILLHRKSEPPTEGVTYICSVKLKKNYGVAWLGPPFGTPALIYAPLDPMRWKVRVSDDEIRVYKTPEEALRYLASRGLRYVTLLFGGLTDLLKEGQKKERWVK